MKWLKNPILWIVIIVAVVICVGYQVTVKTALQQAALKRNQKKVELVDHEYNLYGIAITSPKNIWAIGSGGILLHSVDDGETWEERQLGPPEQVFSSISFPDKDNGWVVGTRGMILHTQDGGGTWKKTEKLYSKNSQACSSESLKIYYTKVFFLDTQHGWIVGEMGTVLLTTDGGNVWELVDTDKNLTTLNDIKFADVKSGWAVGEQGVIIASVDGGTTWQDQQSGAQTTLMSVEISPTDKQTLWAGGLEGTVLTTKDRGATWMARTLRLEEEKISNHVYKIYEKESGTKGLGHNSIYTLARNSQQYSFDDGIGWRPFMMDRETENMLKRGWMYDMIFRMDAESVLNKQIAAGEVGESNFGWLVGKSGVVLKTVDSQNWKRVH
ncbi:MAG: YCF48-related protein [Pseudomonadota bacterium]